MSLIIQIGFKAISSNNIYAFQGTVKKWLNILS